MSDQIVYPVTGWVRHPVEGAKSGYGFCRTRVEYLNVEDLKKGLQHYCFALGGTAELIDANRRRVEIEWLPDVRLAKEAKPEQEPAPEQGEVSSSS